MINVMNIPNRWNSLLQSEPNKEKNNKKHQTKKTFWNRVLRYNLSNSKSYAYYLQVDGVLEWGE